MRDSSWLTAGSPVSVLHIRISGGELFNELFQVTTPVTAIARPWPDGSDFVRLRFERGRGGSRVSAWNQLALP
jgi:hypothetical protein